MGHIGGAVLDKLIETHTELDICAVVRSEKDSAILKKQYGHASFNTAIGNLHDTELMEKLAKNATIIVSGYPTFHHLVLRPWLIALRLWSGLQPRPWNKGATSGPSGKKHTCVLYWHLGGCQHLGSAHRRYGRAHLGRRC